MSGGFIFNIKCHCKLDLESSTPVVTQGTANGVRGRPRIKYGVTDFME